MWEVNCGGVIPVSKGYIVSPSYPSNYGKFLNCEYKIKAPGKAIIYQFTDFSLEQGRLIIKILIRSVSINCRLSGFQDCRYDNVTVKKWSPGKDYSVGYRKIYLRCANESVS